MEKNRPISHQKNVTGSGNVHRRGSGLGTGPVGTTGGRKNSGSGGGNNTLRNAGGGGIGVVLIAVIFFAIKSFLGGGLDVSSIGDMSSSDYLGETTGTTTTSTPLQWESESNTSSLDDSVASGSREKRTEIIGNGEDTVTIMVYMCGTDLESQSGMATSDLKEMASAEFGDKVNLIVYTGGCKKWKNSIISNSVNQIYQVKNGGLICLEEDMGKGAMTSPETLTTFIKYCTTNFPANRNELILWDHGGGSISGYGYDEKNQMNGSMNLAGLNNALKNSGATFDFIGFDACLMATLETALTVEPYADYLIASEETEPGVGWYYTNWLNTLNRNTSTSTLDIGKNIVDDFVDYCGQKCPGQKTTLSVVDLAELKNTVPSELTSFSKSTSELIANEGYKTVADARNKTREFATSSKIDQVDLVHLATNMKTDEGKALATAVKGTVKYNRTSSNMTNAYGLAIYFPYKKTSGVNQASAVYSQIGMNDEYSKCIKEFAGVEVSGQQTTGGTSSPLDVLLGGSSTPSSSAGGNIDMITTLLGGLLGDGSNSFMNDISLDRDATARYLADNYFDPDGLIWTNDNGSSKICISEDQWALVSSIALNVFVDDGEGYIDMGLDNQFDYDENGNLIGDYDGTWLAINNNPVAYYVTEITGTEDNYYITGYVPAMLNDKRVEIIIVFDTTNPNGYVAGARRVYNDGETETIAKNMLEIQDGDKIDFICDYYNYSGEYIDSYYLGDAITVSGVLNVSYVDIGKENANVSYRFTDIYQQNYWTPALK